MGSRSSSLTLYIAQVKSPIEVYGKAIRALTSFPPYIYSRTRPCPTISLTVTSTLSSFAIFLTCMQMLRIDGELRYNYSKEFDDGKYFFPQ